MKVHEKIRVMRQQKGWSQEEMAEKLYMSVNGYANIERGETDVKISRLHQIAKVFEMDLLELFNFGEKNIVYFSGEGFSNNYSNTNGDSINNYFSDKELRHELEKLRLELKNSQLLAQQFEKEVSYLKTIINMMEKESK